MTTDFRFSNPAEPYAPEMSARDFVADKDNVRTAKINFGKSCVLLSFFVIASVPDSTANNKFYYDIDCEPIESSVNISLSNGYYLDSFQKKLDELLTLEEGWDGYGALPIEKQSYKNMKDAIKMFDRNVLSRFNLFPGTNGTLILSAKGKDIASINIGNEKFSYFAVGHDGKDARGEKPFSEDKFMYALKEIENVLGWK